MRLLLGHGPEYAVPVLEMAFLAGTKRNEILAGIGRRVPRVHARRGEACGMVGYLALRWGNAIRNESCSFREARVTRPAPTWWVNPRPRGCDVRFVAVPTDLPALVADEARPGDLVLVMAARDPSLTDLGQAILVAPGAGGET